jgi:hypothetical protein
LAGAYYAPFRINSRNFSDIPEETDAWFAQLGDFLAQSTALAEQGVPVVLEQKTTILWKCLYLLASLKDSSGWGGAHETNRRGEEENPVHRQNTTVNVDKIRGFRPPYMWMKTFVFFLTIGRKSTDRCFLYACYGNPRTCPQRASIAPTILFLRGLSSTSISTANLTYFNPLESTDCFNTPGGPPASGLRSASLERVSSRIEIAGLAPGEPLGGRTSRTRYQRSSTHTPRGNAARRGTEPRETSMALPQRLPPCVCGPDAATSAHVLAAMRWAQCW